MRETGIIATVLIVLIVVVIILDDVNGLTTFALRARSPFRRSSSSASVRLLLLLRYPSYSSSSRTTTLTEPQLISFYYYPSSYTNQILSTTTTQLNFAIDNSNNNNNNNEDTDSTSSSFTNSKNNNNNNNGLLDQIGLLFYNIEMDRVNRSSTYDEKGRYGEPLEWSESKSIVNQFTSLVSSNPIGYIIKQFIADTVAGSNYNRTIVQQYIQEQISKNDIVMFSFTTCPFCRRAKDILDERGIQYISIELDDAIINNSTINNNSNINITGNQIRAELGRITRRTSVPNIFIHQQSIGGCNDGTPGLVPLIESGQFDTLLLLKREDSKVKIS